MTDADPLWHPQGLTFFDPTPPPYLTHENIMEKTAHTLGRLLRSAGGMCSGICRVPPSPPPLFSAFIPWYLPRG